MITCLDTVIGLSRTVCNCYEDQPADYDVSDSGLYIDELEGLNLQIAGGAADCEQGGVFDLLQKSPH